MLSLLLNCSQDRVPEPEPLEELASDWVELTCDTTLPEGRLETAVVGVVVRRGVAIVRFPEGSEGVEVRSMEDRLVRIAWTAETCSVQEVRAHAQVSGRLIGIGSLGSDWMATVSSCVDVATVADDASFELSVPTGRMCELKGIVFYGRKKGPIARQLVRSSGFDVQLDLIAPHVSVLVDRPRLELEKDYENLRSYNRRFHERCRAGSKQACQLALENDERMQRLRTWIDDPGSAH